MTSRYTRRKLKKKFEWHVPRLVCPCCGNNIAAVVRLKEVIARPVSGGAECNRRPGGEEEGNDILVRPAVAGDIPAPTSEVKE